MAQCFDRRLSSFFEKNTTYFNSDYLSASVAQLPFARLYFNVYFTRYRHSRERVNPEKRARIYAHINLPQSLLIIAKNLMVLPVSIQFIN